MYYYVHVCNIVLLYMLCVCVHTLNFVVGLLHLGVQKVCPLVPAHTCINKVNKKVTFNLTHLP